MRSSLRLALSGLIAVTLLVLGLPLAADANVGYSQQVVMVGQKPAVMSSRYLVNFTDYGDWYKRCFYHGHDAPPTCTNYGYRAAHGQFQTKLTTYRLKERIRKYDYYLLDADTNVAKHSGSYTWGDSYVMVHQTGSAIVSRTESKSIRRDSGSCAALQLGISTPWPGITASVPLGTVTLCATNSSFNRHVSTSTYTWYKDSGLAKTNHLDVNRWVQVKAGVHPSFKVQVRVPVDHCTKYKTVGSSNWCQSFDNLWTTKSYYVHTTG